MTDKNTPVSSTDELTVDNAKTRDRARRSGEFKSTNAPLSAHDTAQRPGGKWQPRTTKNIGDLEPVPEEASPVEPDPSKTRPLKQRNE